MSFDKNVNASRRLGLGSLKQSNILSHKTGSGARTDPATHGSFGNRNGSKVPIKVAEAIKTHSS